MPLDRRITIQDNDGTRNSFGEYTEEWMDVTSAWAERRSAGSVDVEEAGGIVELESVTWTVRYTSTLAALPISATRIVDANGHTWNVEGISESDERRRFLTFRTIREATA